MLMNGIYTKTKNKPLKFFKAADFDTPRPLDIIVVAFNDVSLLEYQYSFMQKNLIADEYHYIICDNSNNSENAEQIFEFCRSHNISYYRLPQFLYIGPSHSHGYALNWIYRYIVRTRQNDFALIDHDIFPIKPVRLTKYLEKPLGGVSRIWHGFWFPWPAFSFYNYEFVKDKNLNFLPCRYKHKHLDTGGGNHKVLCHNLPENLWGGVSDCYFDVNNGQPYLFSQKRDKESKEQNIFIYNNVVEIIDDTWLHIMGGSKWGGDHDKLTLSLKMLKR